MKVDVLPGWDHPVLGMPITTLKEAEAFLDASHKAGLWRRDHERDVVGALGYAVVTPVDLGRRYGIQFYVTTLAVFDTCFVAWSIRENLLTALKDRARLLNLEQTS